MENMKIYTLSILGAIGGITSNLLGGWNTAMQTLLVLMAIDYISGLGLGVMGLSNKSESGLLNSNAGFKGLIKKGFVLLMVIVATQLDNLTGTKFIRDGAVIAFCLNEIISIIENIGIAGVPIPGQIKKGIELLKEKEDK